MKYRFFGKDIAPACALCEMSTKSESGIASFCKYHGKVEGNFSCRRFRYDPLKRVPHRRMPLPEYDHKDFEL